MHRVLRRVCRDPGAVAVGRDVLSRILHGSRITLLVGAAAVVAGLIGASDARIATRHVLPGIRASIMVLATLAMAKMLIAEASLSFLGLGVPAGTPTWGLMISEGREYLLRAWWIATYPGLAILVTVMAVNLLGDALRDALDPRGVG